MRYNRRMIERRRRLVVVLLAVLISVGGAVYERIEQQQAREGYVQPASISTETTEGQQSALAELEKLEVKGRAAKTGYKRAQFGDGWGVVAGCDVRNLILKRDLREAMMQEGSDCLVAKGSLYDPYTGKDITFVRGPDTSDDVQIDHVVALSDAWQKGAQQLTREKREEFANDPLNLLAVDGDTNQKKGDSDAATWLPPNKEYRCRYVARQVAVKVKYKLWVTEAEKSAIQRTLANCQGQVLPAVTD